MGGVPGQVHPQDQVHPPGPDTPPRTRYTPRTSTPPGPGTLPWDQVHPSGPGTPPRLGTPLQTSYLLPQHTATAVDCTHPTGMHSCLLLEICNYHCLYNFHSPYILHPFLFNDWNILTYQLNPSNMIIIEKRKLTMLGNSHRSPAPLPCFVIFLHLGVRSPNE